MGLVKVLVAYPLKERHWSRLRRFAGAVDLAAATRPSDVRRRLKDAEVLVCLPQVVPFPAGPAPRLRWVHLLAAGAEDVADWLPPGVVLTATHHAQAGAVADHALALLLAMTRGLACFRDRQRSHQWDRSVPVATLASREAVVVGLGAIGRQVARRALAFGLHVTGVSRRGAPAEEADQVVPAERLEDVLPRAQVLFLCVPLTPATRGLIGERELARLPRGAYLVNVARGEVVDQVALAAALAAGQLTGAGLDVFAEEPLPADFPLWDLERAVITPHMGGVHPGYTADALAEFARNLDRYLAGRPLAGVVDPARGY
ncbi:MAG: D-2-hydroxyacid dehydrogenase [Candidatus Bipolaricaulaceae bacterium]